MEKKKIVKKIISISTAIALMLNSPYALDLLIKAEPESEVAVEPEPSIDLLADPPAADGGTHNHDGWIAWTDDSAFPKDAGSYYLMTNVTLSEAEEIENNISLCLNGYTITLADNAYFRVCGKNITFSLYDCPNGETTGTITGGSVVVEAYHEMGEPIPYGVTFNMYGGMIKDNSAFNDCGGVDVGPDCTFNMRGGTIDNCTAQDCAGGVGNYGTFNMYDGSTISNCHAGSQGGGVYNNNGNDPDCAFNMYGGEIINCSAGSGGGVYSQGGAVTMSGGTISNCTSTNHGGGVNYNNSAAFAMSNGTISNCTATNRGGAIYSDGGDSFTMTNSTISGCEAADGGGLYTRYLDITMTDSNISSCTATKQGGGIYNEGCTTIMSDSTISGCTATEYGGGFYVTANSEITMNGGNISNCRAVKDGGGMYFKTNYDIIITLNKTVDISSNKRGTEPNTSKSNLFLYNKLTITIGDEFSTDSTVGVTTQKFPTSTEPITISGTLTTNVSTSFTSDNDECVIMYDDSDTNAKVLKLRSHTLPDPFPEDQTNEDEHWYTCPDSGCNKEIRGAHTWVVDRTEGVDFKTSGNLVFKCVVCQKEKTEPVSMFTDTTAWKITNRSGLTLTDTGTFTYKNLKYPDYSEKKAGVPALRDGNTWTPAEKFNSKPSENNGGSLDFTSPDFGTFRYYFIPSLSTPDVWNIQQTENTDTTDAGTVYTSIYFENPKVYITTAHVHHWGPWTFSDDLTINHGGRATHTCSKSTCTDYDKKETEDVPKLSDNSWTKVEWVTQPTLENKGTYKFNHSTYGDVTGEIPALTDSMWTPAAFTDTNKPTTEAGCTLEFTNEKGYDSVTVEIPSLSTEGAWDISTTPPIGTTDGEDVYTLKDCNSVKVTVSICGHDWGDWVWSPKPTISTTGTATRTCKKDDCNETESAENVPALSDDTWAKKEWVTEPTLENKGTYKFNNSTYGDVTGEIPALTDTMWTPAAFTDTNKPTTEAGCTLEFTSTDYGAVEAAIPVLSDEAWNISTTPINGTTDGEDVYTLKSYPSLQVTVTIHAHNWGAWNWVTKPTINGTGTATRTCSKAGCSISGNTETVEGISALSVESAWTKVEWVTEPTLKNKGTYKFNNSTYGDVEGEIPALTDSMWTPAAFTDTNKPTTEAGCTLNFTSSDYGTVEAAIPALSSKDWDISTTPINGTTDGKTVYTLKSRTSITVTVTIHAHNWGAWNWVTQPTINGTGTATRTCSKDGCSIRGNTETVGGIPTLSVESAWTKKGWVTKPTLENKGTYKFNHSTYGDVTGEIPALTDTMWTPAAKFTLEPSTEADGTLNFTNEKGYEAVLATVPSLSTNGAWTKSHIPSTADADGKDVYTSKYFENPKVSVPAHDHDWSVWAITTKPTIDKEGEATRTCTNGEDHSETKSVPALSDDTWTKKGWVTKPKLETKGTYKFNNSVYGDVTGEIPALTDTMWTPAAKFTLEPSTEADGTLNFTNAKGYEAVLATVPSLSTNGAWTKSHIPSTADADGKDVYTSKYFENPKVSIPAHDHNWSTWTLSKDPTIDKEGEATRTCTNGEDHSETKSVPALSDDTWTKKGWVTKPKLETKGTYKFNNSVYGDVTGEIPALSDKNVWTKVDAECQPATETQSGKDVYESVYGKVEVTIAPLGHKHVWGKWTLSTKPTIDEEGEATRICDTIADHKETKSVPALSDAATWGKGGIVTKPALDSKGTYKFTNSVYGDVTGEIPALSDKNVWTKVDAECQPATETQSGKDVYESVYGKVEVTIAPLGHKHVWGKWTLSTKPTIDQEGEATRTCSTIADHKETKSVPALSDAATWGKGGIVTEPTLENKGTYKFTNSDYGDVTVEIPALSDTTVWTKDGTDADGNDIYKSDKYGEVKVSSSTGSDQEEDPPAEDSDQDENPPAEDSDQDEDPPAEDSDQEEDPPADPTSTTTTTEATVPTSEAEPTETDFFPNIDLGSIVKEVEQKEDVPTADLATPIRELLQAVMPKAELTAIKETDNIKIVLKIEDASQTVPTEDKQQVEAVLQENSHYTLGQYLDVTLLKIVNNNETKITNTSAPITVTFEVPVTSRKANRAFSVIRVHGDERTVLNDLDNDPDTVTIKTDKFSTYALAYIDKEGNPNTGVYVSIIPLAMAAVSLGALAIKKKSKKK